MKLKKTNKKFIENSNGAIIQKLFWLPAQCSNRELKETFENDMDLGDRKSAFPDVEDIQNYLSIDDLNKLCYEYNKFGFLVQVAFPKVVDWTRAFDNIKPINWIYDDSTIIYLYGDTMKKLVAAINQKAKYLFLNSIK